MNITKCRQRIISIKLYLHYREYLQHHHMARGLHSRNIYYLFTDSVHNWLHGHSSGWRGVAQYSSPSSPYYLWNTLQNNVGTTDDWLVMCGKNAGTSPNNILADGVASGTAVGGVGGDILTINGGGSSGTTLNSNFAFSQLLIWNQALNDADMLTASHMLTSYMITGSYFSYATTWPYAIPKPMAWYRAEQYLRKWNALPDALGNGAMDAVTSGLVYGNSSGNGASASIAYVTGTTSSIITWPQGTIPSTFTVCSLTRYTGGTNDRILNSVSTTWLHGHQNGMRGVAYYKAGWQTVQSTYGLSVNNCELISLH